MQPNEDLPTSRSTTFKHNPPLRSVRVLSLDGGGTKGLVQAVILEKIENALNAANSTKLPIGVFFDLVVGTSIGGIVALAISKGLHAAEIRQTLRNELQTIFPSKSFSALRGWMGPKYDRAPLRLVLERLFEKTTLGDLPHKGCPHVCVVAHNPISKRARLFKSPSHTGLNALSAMSLVDIGLATSAAPTYFDSFKVHMPDTNVESHLLDGGLVANNPALVALIEAAKHFDRETSSTTNWSAASALSAGNVKLLSIGTGNVPQTAGKMASPPPTGKLGWASQLHDHVLAAQADFAEYVARTLLPDESYLRVNPTLGAECQLDSAVHVLGMINSIHLTSGDERKALERFSRLNRYDFR